MTPPRVLLLGGHGKISMLMTPLMLQRSWSVTSVIRNPEHEREIRDLSKNQPGHLDVLVASLEDVKSASDAKKVLDQAKPDYVVWSAGAGGKGDPSRTFAVDRDAAKAYIEASLTTPSIKKFLMISYIVARRNRPSWWTDSDWSTAQKTNTEILPKYFEAKVVADEFLVAHAKKRERDGDETFQAIDLRPGSLTDNEATGKVKLGHTPSSGKVTRADVADVAVRLLERNDTRGYYDLLNGDEEIGVAVERVVREKIDCFEGEDAERIYGLVQ